MKAIYVKIIVKHDILIQLTHKFVKFNMYKFLYYGLSEDVCRVAERSFHRLTWQFNIDINKVALKVWRTIY